MPSSAPKFVVLGAGVVGLTTALELNQTFPSSTIVVVAKYLPGSTSATEYTSPWAGANWSSFGTKSTRIADYDRATFLKFKQIAEQSPESGLVEMPCRTFYDNEESAKETWYAELVGGVKPIPEEELPPGAIVGIEVMTFMINTIVYLSWSVNDSTSNRNNADSSYIGSNLNSSPPMSNSNAANTITSTT